MTNEEVEVLEFINNSIDAIYHDEIPFYLADLIRLHTAGYIYSNSDYGYGMGDDVDYYHLTEKGHSALEAHYLEERLKVLLS
jgi:hypothetical protein